MDKISNVESFQLHSPIVVFRYLLLVLGHSLGCLVSNFIQTIQVLLQLIVIALLVKEFPLKASELYFDRDDCFCAIRQVEWCLLLVFVSSSCMPIGHLVILGPCSLCPH